MRSYDESFRAQKVQPESTKNFQADKPESKKPAPEILTDPNGFESDIANNIYSPKSNVYNKNKDNDDSPILFEPLESHNPEGTNLKHEASQTSNLNDGPAKNSHGHHLKGFVKSNERVGYNDSL